MRRLLLLDNYDSFTYNLLQILELDEKWQIDVFKNDEIDLEEIAYYDKIMLSPGPGLPSEAGIMMDLIQKYYTHKSIFGVCLGHHALAESFGAHLFRFSEPVHGMRRQVSLLSDDILFKGIPDSFQVGLYHSWAVSRDCFPTELVETALSEKGVLMAFRHKQFDLRGVQFHPESIMTPFGRQMIQNWLDA